VTHLALGWHEVIVSWSLDGVELPAISGSQQIWIFLCRLRPRFVTLHQWKSSYKFLLYSLLHLEQRKDGRLNTSALNWRSIEIFLSDSVRLKKSRMSRMGLHLPSSPKKLVSNSLRKYANIEHFFKKNGQLSHFRLKMYPIWWPTLNQADPEYVSPDFGIQERVPSLIPVAYNECRVSDPYSIFSGSVSRGSGWRPIRIRIQSGSRALMTKI